MFIVIYSIRRLNTLNWRFGGFLAILRMVYFINHSMYFSMKRVTLWLLFSMLAFSATYSQCNGNGGYGNNGSGNGGYGNNGNGGNSQWANTHWPQWVITWLENGGQVPMPLAVAAIREARAWGMQNFGLNQGQMLVKYLQGQLTVEYVSTAPPSLTFRVSYSGGIAIVILQDF